MNSNECEKKDNNENAIEKGSVDFKESFKQLKCFEQKYYKNITMRYTHQEINTKYEIEFQKAFESIIKSKNKQKAFSELIMKFSENVYENVNCYWNDKIKTLTERISTLDKEIKQMKEQTLINQQKNENDPQLEELLFKKLSIKSDIVKENEHNKKNENRIIDYIESYIAFIFMLIEHNPNEINLILHNENGLLYEIINFIGTHQCKGYITLYDSIINLFVEKDFILKNISWEIFINNIIKPFLFDFIYQDEVKMNMKIEYIFKCGYILDYLIRPFNNNQQIFPKDNIIQNKTNTYSQDMKLMNSGYHFYLIVIFETILDGIIYNLYLLLNMFDNMYELLNVNQIFDIMNQIILPYVFEWSKLFPINKNLLDQCIELIMRMYSLFLLGKKKTKIDFITNTRNAFYNNIEGLNYINDLFINCDKKVISNQPKVFIEYFGYRDIEELNQLQINITDIRDNVIEIDDNVKKWNKKIFIDNLKGSLTGTFHMMNNIQNQDDILINYNKHPLYVKDEYRNKFYLSIYKADTLIRDIEREPLWKYFNNKINILKSLDKQKEDNNNSDSDDYFNTNNINNSSNSDENENNNYDDNMKIYKILYIAFTNIYHGSLDIISHFISMNSSSNLAIPSSCFPFSIILQSISTYLSTQSLININTIPSLKILCLLTTLSSKFKNIGFLQTELSSIFTILSHISSISTNLFTSINNKFTFFYYNAILSQVNNIIFKIRECLSPFYLRNSTIITLILKCLLFYMENKMESTLDLAKTLIIGRKPSNINKTELSEYYFKLFVNNINDIDDKGKFKRFITNIKELLMEGSILQQEVIEIMFRNHIKEMIDLLFTKYKYEYIVDNRLMEQIFVLVNVILMYPIDIETYDMLLYKFLMYSKEKEIEGDDNESNITENKNDKRNIKKKKSTQKEIVQIKAISIMEIVINFQNALVANMLRSVDYNKEYKKVFSLIKTLFPNANDVNELPYQFNRYTFNILACSYINKERLFIVKDRTNIERNNNKGIKILLSSEMEYAKDVPYINMERLINGILLVIHSQTQIRLCTKFLWYNTLHLSIFTNKTFNTLISFILNPSKPMFSLAMNHLSTQLRLLDICTVCSYIMPSSLLHSKYIHNNISDYFSPIYNNNSTHYEILLNIIQPFTQLLKTYLERYEIEHGNEQYVANDIIIQVKKIISCFCFILNSLYNDINVISNDITYKEDYESINSIVDLLLNNIYTFLHLDPNTEYRIHILDAMYTCKEVLGLCNNNIILKCITITLISAFPRTYSHLRKNDLFVKQLSQLLLQMKELLNRAGKLDHAVEEKFHSLTSNEEIIHCINIGQFLLLSFIDSIKSAPNDPFDKANLYTILHSLFSNYPHSKQNNITQQSITRFLKQADFIIKNNNSHKEEQENKIRKQLYKTLKHNFNNTSIYIKQNMLIVLNQQISLNAYDIYLVTQMNYNRFTLGTKELNEHCGSTSQHNELLNEFGKSELNENDDISKEDKIISKPTSVGFDIALYYLTSFGMDKLEKVKKVVDEQKMDLLLKLNERSLKYSFNVGVFYVGFYNEPLETKHLLCERKECGKEYNDFMKVLNKELDNAEEESHVFISEDKFNEVIFEEYDGNRNEYVKECVVALVYLENGHQNIKDVNMLFDATNERVYFIVSHIDKSFYLIRRRINNVEMKQSGKEQSVLNNYIVDINKMQSIQFMINQIVFTYDYLKSECNGKVKKSNYDYIEQRNELFSKLLEDNENEK